MIGSHLMIGLKGTSLTSEEAKCIVEEKIAGVILFKRNIANFKQLHSLCSELKSLPLEQPLLLGIDMEGGEVNRLSHLPDSLKWPSALSLVQQSDEQIFEIAKTMAQRLHALGFDINFAPVVDLPIVESSLLKTRVFGSNKQSIVQKAESFKKGLLAGGIIPCLKHFPGHGGVSEDSHKVLPQDLRTLKDLEEQLQIFESLSKDSCIMTAHIEFPNIDNQPASFSSKFLREELRNKRGFSSVIFSDDIDMHALDQFSPDQRALKCLEGSCDLILSCQQESTYKQIIEFFRNYQISRKLLIDLKESDKRLAQLKRNQKPQPWSKIETILQTTTYKFD